MPYSFATWGDMKLALSRRLGDAVRFYWTDDGSPYGPQYSELHLYLAEAVRTWNSLTGWFRERGAFSTSAGVSFYDLVTQLPSLLSRAVLDRDLAAILQYHLIEPLAVDGTWTGTAQYTADDIAKAIQRRRNQFLADTGCVLTRNSALGIPGPPVGRIPLPDSIIQVQRLAWNDADTGAISPIWPADEYSATGNLVQGLWTNPFSPPLSYSILPSPPLTLQLIPPPLSSGTLDLVYVASGADVALATGVPLGVPDDFAWVVKWGALADLLFREGIAYDPIRAAVCESRYGLGVTLAKLLGCVLQVEINGIPIQPSPISDFDCGMPYWQALRDTPTSVALIGDWLALAPAPDGVYGIALDVIRKAPIPTSDGEFIQIGREHVDTILDYAVHLASFKQAGAEFMATVPQAEAFFRQAIAQNNRIDATSLFPKTVREQSEDEYRWRPKERVGAGMGVLATTGDER